MKQISILSGCCLVVELPEGQQPTGLWTIEPNRLFYVDKNGCDTNITLPPGNWRIIGMLSEVTEQEVISLFDKERVIADGLDLAFRNYNGGVNDWLCTALESLESSILAAGFYFENPYGKDEPVVDDPDPHSQYYGAQQDELTRWHQAQSRVLDRSRCLLLGREE